MRTSAGPPDSASGKHSLLKQIPDEPAWVETRSMLLSARSTVIREPDGCVVFDPILELACVVGKPESAALHRASESTGPGVVILSQIESTVHLRERLQGWTESTALILRLANSSLPPAPARHDVWVLAPGQTGNLPPVLSQDLQHPAQLSFFSVAFEGTNPVSLCHATHQTETLWDVSITTLADQRNRGYGAACAASLIQHYAALGKEPVWGVEEANHASRRLAEKLGFIPVSAVSLFRRSK